MIFVQKQGCFHTIAFTDLMANISLNDYQMPMEEDYKGAFTALRRLQDTYQLKPVEISSGQLGGLNMTARDCYNAGTYVCVV